ncbi:hypothetical protein ACGFZU_35270 [Streptomyces tendae]|uniref:hypothetical protein n=1 Tax=Streptomyces tendae TaxID=1932 RepID=UPI00371389A9
MTRSTRTPVATLAASAARSIRPHLALVDPLHDNVTVAWELWNMPADQRRARLAALPHSDLLDVFTVIGRYEGSPYELWHDSPAGFAEDILGMTVTDEERALLDAAANEWQVVARVPVPGNYEIAAALSTWASLRMWDRRQWTAAVVAAGEREASHMGQVLDQAQQIACLPEELLRVCIGWQPRHFTGLPDMHFAVVPDADRIGDGDLQNMLSLALRTGVIRRMVALSGADWPPTPWFAQFEQWSEVTW